MTAVADARNSQPGFNEKAQPVSMVPFEFTGRAWEYFKIWIVNILLTILTLGIYSAWAKVRRKRYFYGSTLLQASPFEYLAEPIQILKGRLIAFGIFVVYFILNNFLPVLAGVLALLFVFVFPWLVVKAHTFNTRYSSYRNIRFDFRGNYAKALAVYVGLPVLSVLTLGLAYPAYTYHRSKFMVGHSGYGTAPFTFSATAGGFYLVYLKAMLILVAGAMAFVALAAALGTMPPLMNAAANGPGIARLGQMMLFFAMAALLVLLTVRAYLETALANLVWGNVVAGGNRFKSTLRTPHMLWLYLSNAAGIIVSLGLLTPWAQVRMTRYRLDNLKLLATSDLESFVAHEQEQVASAGEEISEFFDFDIGL